jgi:type II secretory pathway component PulL
MKKVGFIDIQSSSAPYEPGAVHIFSETGEYEKSFESATPDVLKDIETFYASIPLSLLDFRIINLPFSDREKLQKVIPLELENLILESSEAVVFDTVTLSSDTDNVEVLVAYAKKDILQQILSRLAQSGVDPGVVTSIDLRAALDAGHNLHESTFSEAVTRRLINPVEISESDRKDLEGQEIIKPTINLRTGTFTYTKGAEKIRRRIKQAAIFAGALAIAIHANILIHTMTIKKETNSVRQAMHSMYSGLFPGEQTIVDELYQMKSHMKEIRTKSDALIGISPLSFLSNLSKKMDANITYNDIQIEKGLIKMKAEASKMEVLDAVKARLSEFLSDVSISDVRPGANGRIVFTVVAKGER